MPTPLEVGVRLTLMYLKRRYDEVGATPSAPPVVSPAV
jgi:hypothetical protein